MHISFTFKNFEPSEHLRKYARRRMEKLGRFMGKNPALDVQVLMSVDKFRQRVEVQIAGEGLNVTADEISEDMYTSIDLVLDKLEAQVKKFVSRSKETTRKARQDTRVEMYTLDVDEDDGPVITEHDHFPAKPMSVDEAVMQLGAKDLEFLTFFNAETERVNVIYRRKNGSFGLIDPVV